MALHNYSPKINTKTFNDNFSSLYQLSDLKQLYDVVNSSDLGNWWKNLFSKASDFISSLRIYPFKVSELNKYLLLDKTRDTTIIGGTERKLTSRQFNGKNRTFIIGKYEVPKATSFMDFEPFTQCQLYLPYLSFIDLPLNEIRGKTIEVLYTIDFTTGVATAYVQTSLGYRTLIAVKSGKIGIDVPWGVNNNLENTKNVINTAISTAIQLTAISATGGTSEVALMAKGVSQGVALSKSALSIANSLQLRYERGGTAGSLSNIVMPNHPYLLLKTQNMVDVNDEEYAHTYGKPLYKERVLSTLKGYTVIDEIHLEQLPNATQSEIDEIESLLKRGVHF